MIPGVQSETYRRALEHSGDMVWITDAEGVVVYANPALADAMGFPCNEIIGRKSGELWRSGRHDQSFFERLWSTVKRGEIFRDVIANRTRGGGLVYIEETISPVYDASGSITHFLVIGRDAVQRLREPRLRHLAYFDPVTGLANRAYFEDSLDNALVRARRFKRAFAYLLMDVDRLRDVNEGAGHMVGDDLLHQIGQRLTAGVRGGDFVARFDGGTFAIVLEPVKNTGEILAVAETLLHAIDKPFRVQERQLTVKASVGIAAFPLTGDDKETLLWQAESALQEAKACGEGHRLYSTTTNRLPSDALAMEAGLARVLNAGGLGVQYQPIMALGDRSITGLEALARCEIPGFGRLPPVTFIPVAERSGLIHKLGDQILNLALRQAQAWKSAKLDVGQITVNLSPVQFEAEDLPLRVEQALKHSGWPSERLEFEITEEALIQGDNVLPQIHRLRDLGVTFALDDFGVGYSSPEYLKHLPVNRLKIDRSFIQNIHSDPANQVILGSMLALAAGFGFQVTMEGVESEEEERYLLQVATRSSWLSLSLESYWVQGYLYSKPLDADDVAGMFSRKP